MAAQIQMLDANGAWVTRSTIEGQPTARLIEMIGTARQAVRLYSNALDRFLAESPAAQEQRTERREPAFDAISFLALRDARLSDRPEPDAYNMPEPRSMLTKRPGVYSRFAKT